MRTLIDVVMQLKCISVSTNNYKNLKNLGKAGDSFNDVITDLLKKVGSIEN